VVRRLSIIVGVVVFVLTVYAIKLAVFPSPEATVQRYFEALEDRNLSAAVDELADHLSLAWTADADRGFRPPHGVRTGGWQAAPTAQGERLVAVQYELGRTTYNSLIKLRKLNAVWKISNGTGTLEMNGLNALINGNSMGPDRNLRLLPGIYEVTIKPGGLLTAPPVTVVVTPEKAASVRMSTTLAANALDTVRERLNTIIRACETTMDVKADNCPFQNIDTTGLGRIQGELISMPEVVIEQTGPDSVAVKGIGPGSVRLKATDANGVDIERVDSFSLNGMCVDKDAFISCTFSV
jgi:hypothetical protein